MKTYKHHCRHTEKTSCIRAGNRTSFKVW